MGDGINVNYEVLEECISSLETLIEDEELSTKIAGLDKEFDNSKSGTTDALKARKEEYTEVNNVLNNLATNIIAVLKLAKTIYGNTDAEMTTALTGTVETGLNAATAGRP